MAISLVSRTEPTYNAAPVSSPSLGFGLIARIVEAVSKSMTQMNESQESKRVEIQRLKAEYKSLTAQSAEATRSIGNLGLKGAGFTLLTGALYLSPYTSDHQFAKLFQELCPKVEGLFTAQIRARQQGYDANSQLTNTVLSSELNNESADGNAKQKLQEVMQNAVEGWRVAARST